MTESYFINLMSKEGYRKVQKQEQNKKCNTKDKEIKEYVRVLENKKHKTGKLWKKSDVAYIKNIGKPNKV
jgi:hypothetical protein